VCVVVDVLPRGRRSAIDQHRNDLMLQVIRIVCITPAIVSCVTSTALSSTCDLSCYSHSYTITIDNR
jgi:hypothetical protein